MRTLSLDDLTIDDERELGGIAIYGRLKQALRRSNHRFQIPAVGEQASWDRVLFLNLTYWDGTRATDVLCDHHLAADELAHIAWHEVVAREVARRARVATDGAAPGPTAAGLFFAESIASAFDLYLVGRLLLVRPDADFITTQVPLLGACAEEAGQAEAAFAEDLQEMAREPERAFEDMRTLLFDAARALHLCAGAESAQAVLEGLAGRRFAALLHHYQLSNWILYARAYGTASAGADRDIHELDEVLRRAPVSLDWLADHWIDADIDIDAGPAARPIPPADHG